MASGERAAKRIVHFSSVHSVDDVRVFLKECRSLAAAGYDVTLVARGDTSDTVDGVKRIGVPRGRGNRLQRMVFETLKVARIAWGQKADLYHFHDPELLPVGLALKLAGKTVVYDAHENIRDQVLSKPYLPSWSRRALSVAVGAFESFSVRRLDGVVCATPRIAQTLATPHTIEALNYPVAEEISIPDNEGERDPAKVVFVGGFTAIRGAAQMIDAVALVNQRMPARLVICGTMPADVRSRSEQQAGWTYVDDLGWQTRSQTQHHMATAACGLCVFLPEPNHVEAVPNKLFEYMAAGLPVVASNFPFWEQFVADVGAGVLVDPEDPKSIADGLGRILDDPEHAAAMGAAGRKAVRERFNWDIESHKLVALVSGLVGSSSSTRQ